MQKQTHLLFFITEDWFFCSHRLPLAKAALACGYKVTLVTRVRQHGDIIRAHGINLIPLELNRRSLNPLHEFKLLAQLYAIYRRERPDIVHQVALKPVLYGSIAAILAKIPNVVNAIAGLGFIFISKRPLARLLKPIITFALRRLLSGNTHVILQNPDDLKLIRDLVKLPSQNIHLIRGAGVELDIFYPAPSPPEESLGPIVLFPARLLWDKGLGEFIEAARILGARGITARYILVGSLDPANPAAVPEERVQAWITEGLVEWWGHRDDMPDVLRNSHIVCLPSYREGLPKALAEAAACGLPIVTTDAPGCREVVRHNGNGLLVPIKDAETLANALANLICNPKLRVAYGAAGRHSAEAELGSKQVIAATLAIYSMFKITHK